MRKILILVIYGMISADFSSAVEFLFRPDFSELTGASVLMALGQAITTAICIDLKSGQSTKSKRYPSMKPFQGTTYKLHWQWSWKISLILDGSLDTLLL